jgi:hypothetical protein
LPVGAILKENAIRVLVAVESVAGPEVPQVSSGLKKDGDRLEASLRRDALEHGLLHRVHRNIAAVEQLAALCGQVGVTHRAVRLRRSSLEQSTLLERADHLVHGLRGDKRTTGQLRIGVPATTTDETQRCVFGNGQFEATEDRPKATAKAAIQGSYGIAEAWPFQVLASAVGVARRFVGRSIVHVVR